jgi:nicotinamide riboside transporter PnuC
MTWLLTVLSVVGVVLNIRQNRACFVIWTFTNADWAWIDFRKGIYAQAALFSLYLVLSVWGIYRWRHNKMK